MNQSDRHARCSQEISVQSGWRIDARAMQRDLKPANIKVRADGAVKVLDFGLAKTIEPTASGAIIGTLVWVARSPELPRVSRLQLPPSGPAALTINWNDRDLAITPDGSRLIYIGNRGTQIFVRTLDALAPVPVFTGQRRDGRGCRPEALVETNKRALLRAFSAPDQRRRELDGICSANAMGVRKILSQRPDLLGWKYFIPRDTYLLKEMASCEGLHSREPDAL